jgi:hypothetical protein
MSGYYPVSSMHTYLHMYDGEQYFTFAYRWLFRGTGLGEFSPTFWPIVYFSQFFDKVARNLGRLIPRKKDMYSF